MNHLQKIRPEKTMENCLKQSIELTSKIMKLQRIDNTYIFNAAFHDRETGIEYESNKEVSGCDAGVCYREVPSLHKSTAAASLDEDHVTLSTGQIAI